MKPLRYFSVLFFIQLIFLSCCVVAQTKSLINKSISDLTVGAEQVDQYLPLIRGKTIAVVANQTSMIRNTHLVDSLLSLHIKIKCVFAPEHGFRGNTEAGGKIKNGRDEKTGLPVISLYGKHVKPTAADLKGVDIIIFDIQDVGARFYTYIATLQYAMEACAEQKKTLLVLDRPNPNGFYVDGPVMEKEYESFVGLTPIPIVHALTVAEYALMLNGEHWLKNGEQCDLKIIKVKNYAHNNLYALPVKPSPNLPNTASIYLYPSLCLFEGTPVSVGRGTDKPFQQIGFPGFKEGHISFTPKSMNGAVNHPPYEDTLCTGVELSDYGIMYITNFRQLNLQWLQGMYKAYPDKNKFFNNYFVRLAGTATLKEQIINGVSEEDIRKSWKPGLDNYKKIRKKYLLYEDFE
jgi:uncharacterized protein YbbC (DUF1343 family)